MEPPQTIVHTSVIIPPPTFISSSSSNNNSNNSSSSTSTSPPTPNGIQKRVKKSPYGIPYHHTNNYTSINQSNNNTSGGNSSVVDMDVGVMSDISNTAMYNIPTTNSTYRNNNNLSHHHQQQQQYYTTNGASYHHPSNNSYHHHHHPPNYLGVKSINGKSMRKRSVSDSTTLGGPKSINKMNNGGYYPHYPPYYNQAYHHHHHHHQQQHFYNNGNNNHHDENNNNNQNHFMMMESKRNDQPAFFTDIDREMPELMKQYLTFEQDDYDFQQQQDYSYQASKHSIYPILKDYLKDFNDASQKQRWVEIAEKFFTLILELNEVFNPQQHKSKLIQIQQKAKQSNEKEIDNIINHYLCIV